MWRAVGAVAVAAGLALVVYPSAVLVGSSFVSGGRLSLAWYAEPARDPRALLDLWHSVAVSVAATAGGTLLGVGLAALTGRTDLPARRLWETLLLMPYMIPPFIGAIAWVYLLGPVGYLNRAWMALAGASGPLLVVYGPAGIVAVMILYGYPIVYLAVSGALERMDPSLEEAARIARAGPWQVFRDVTVPLIRPAALAGALLLCMSCLGDFGIPVILGEPARYFVLTTRIYSMVLNADQPDHLRAAAALSMWLVGLAAILITLQRRMHARSRATTVGGPVAARSRVALGPWRLPALAGVAAWVLVTSILPLGAIVLTSLLRAYGVPPAPANLTLAHYATALGGVPKVPRAVLNSLGLAAGSATIVVVLGVAIGYRLARLAPWAAAAFDLLISVPYAVPGTVVALAMILAWLRPIPVVGLRLYDTIWILLVAYVARFLVFGVRTVQAGLAQVHGSLEEAARISGAGPLEAFLGIMVPIIRPSLAAGWALAFVPAVAELTLSILLFSVGNETIGVVIFGLHDEGKITLAAALAVLVSLLLVALNVLVRALLGGRAEASHG